MNKEQFWSIIDEVRNEVMAETDDIEEMVEPLVERLSQLSDVEIIRWGKIFALYQKLSYKDNILAADYVINDALSDDGFDYFRAWITAHGKSVFLNALNNPDTLADLNPERLETWCEEMIYASSMAYSQKHSSDTEAEDRYYDEYDKYTLSAEEIAEIEAEILYANNAISADEQNFDWEEDENLLRKMLPKLSEMFM